MLPQRIVTLGMHISAVEEKPYDVNVAILGCQAQIFMVIFVSVCAVL